MKRVLATLLFILLGTLAFAQVSIPTENRGLYTVTAVTRDGDIWQNVTNVSITVDEASITLKRGTNPAIVLNVESIEEHDGIYGIWFSNDAEIFLFNPELMQLALLDANGNMLMVMKLTSGSVIQKYQPLLKQEPPLPSA